MIDGTDGGIGAHPGDARLHMLNRYLLQKKLVVERRLAVEDSSQNN